MKLYKVNKKLNKNEYDVKGAQSFREILKPDDFTK